VLFILSVYGMTKVLRLTILYKLLQDHNFMFYLLTFYFSAVHSVCLWDDKGPQKMYQALQDDILEFIQHAQSVSLLSSCLIN